jgi:hypothetical protein
MSSVEVLNFLKKQLGIITKRLEETGVVATVTAKDHVFIPDIEVSDEGVGLPIEGFLYSIKAHPDYAPVKFNIDRPVTSTEYSVVYPGVIKVISRLAGEVYLKAPIGQVSHVTIEALKAGA